MSVSYSIDIDIKTVVKHWRDVYRLFQVKRGDSAVIGSSSRNKEFSNNYCVLNLGPHPSRSATEDQMHHKAVPFQRLLQRQF